MCARLGRGCAWTKESEWPIESGFWTTHNSGKGPCSHRHFSSYRISVRVCFYLQVYHFVSSMPFRYPFTLELLCLYYRDTFIFIIKTILTWLNLARTVIIILLISFLFFPLPFSSNMIISFITVSEVLKYVWLCLKFLTFNSLKLKCNWSHLSRWESCFFGIGWAFLSQLYS